MRDIFIFFYDSEELVGASGPLIIGKIIYTQTQFDVVDKLFEQPIPLKHTIYVFRKTSGNGA